MFEDDLTGVVVAIVTILAIFGVALLLMDFRHFDNIKNGCTKYGYIQNKTVRITCQVNK